MPCCSPWWDVPGSGIVKEEPRREQQHPEATEPTRHRGITPSESLALAERRPVSYCSLTMQWHGGLVCLNSTFLI